MPPKMMEREKCKESLKRVSQGRASEREDRQKQIERDKVSGEKDRERERESGSDRNNINSTNNSNNNNNNVQRISRSWIHLYIYPSL